MATGCCRRSGTAKCRLHEVWPGPKWSHTMGSAQNRLLLSAWLCRPAASHCPETPSPGRHTKGCRAPALVQQKICNSTDIACGPSDPDNSYVSCESSLQSLLTSSCPPCGNGFVALNALDALPGPDYGVPQSKRYSRLRRAAQRLMGNCQSWVSRFELPRYWWVCVEKISGALAGAPAS